MNILMLSCRKATELMEKKLHTGIGPLENIQLFMHKRMCDGCRLYEQQSRFMDIILRRKSTKPENDCDQKALPAEVRRQIVNELEKL